MDGNSKDPSKQYIIISSHSFVYQTVSLNQYIKQLHSSLAVGRKRRQAQLTRLHHQLQEAQGRRHQWAEEADRLRAAIRKLRQKIEE